MRHRLLDDRGERCAIVHHQDDRLALHLELPGILGGVGPAQQHRRSLDLLGRHAAEGEPRIAIEADVQVLPVDHEADMRLGGGDAALGNGVTLEVGPVFPGRLETELAELIRDVLRGLLQPRTRGVAAHHRIIGNDVDAALNVLWSDGSGSSLEERWKFVRKQRK